MITDLQKLAAQAIINIFETGKALGSYSQVTLIRGDSGHLTYGRSQTTLASGNLYLLVVDYCDAAGAQRADELRPYLARLKRADLTLDNDMTFRRLLKEAGDDPVMHTVQDSFFDRVYWTPAVTAATALGIRTPLGIAVVYDSRVHGSWALMRDRTVRKYGDVAALGEEPWIGKYIATRRSWLATHSNSVLHATVYRMDAFKALIAAGNWKLDLPFTVRGVKLTEELLTNAPVRVSAEGKDDQLLHLTTPLMKGERVKALQTALVAHGIAVDQDGTFGPKTEQAVIAFQKKKGLSADGIVGPATKAALGL